MKSGFAAAGLVALSLLILANGSVVAGPFPGEEKFLVVKGGERITPNKENEALSDLPKELLSELGNYDFGTAENSGPPANLRGFAVDLNHDGKLEYFIVTPALSGSGGVGYFLFSQIGKKWSLVSDFQGAIYIFPAKKGWPKLVTISRGGAGTWAKTYSEFKDGKYHDKMVERFERGTITKDPVEEE